MSSHINRQENPDGPARAWGAPDIVEGLLPAGIMSLVIARSSSSGQAVWSEFKNCMAEQRSFLERHAVRRGPVTELEQPSGETLRIMPSGFWTGTLVVSIDAMSISSAPELRARMEEISESLLGLSGQHWHTNQPAFSVWVCDLFDCGPGNVDDLAKDVFGQLVRGTLYIEETAFEGSNPCGLTLSSPCAVADCRIDDGSFRAS